MVTTIGNTFIYTHDIHYGYESGYSVNFTIKSKNPLTEKEVDAILVKHVNKGKSVQELKDNWENYLPPLNSWENETKIGKHDSFGVKWMEINLTV